MSAEITHDPHGSTCESCRDAVDHDGWTFHPDDLGGYWTSESES